MPSEWRPPVGEVGWNNGGGWAEGREGRRVGWPCMTNGCHQVKNLSLLQGLQGQTQPAPLQLSFVYSWLRKISGFQKGKRKWEIKRNPKGLITKWHLNSPVNIKTSETYKFPRNIPTHSTNMLLLPGRVFTEGAIGALAKTAKNSELTQGPLSSQLLPNLKNKKSQQEGAAGLFLRTGA